MIKWSVHSEKGTFTREVVHSEKGTFTREVEGKHKVSPNSLKIHQNIKVKKYFSYMKHKGKWQKLFGTKLFPVL